MKRKKIIFILLICLIALISVSAISAAGDASTDVIIAGDASTDVISEDIDEDIILEENSNILDVGSEEQISINEENAENTILSESSPKNFSSLNTTINSNDDDIIYLEDDYQYNRSGDAGLEKGIVINRTVTIEGNNHTIDGYWNSIFRITGQNVIIKNINFIHAYGGDFGAISWEGNQGTLANCTFIDNGALIEAGAISWEGNQGTLANCTFISNSVTDWGGAIYWVGDDGKLENNTFNNNSASSDSSFGGAIYWVGVNGILNNNAFTNNSVGTLGGAIYWYGDNGTLNNNTFTNNSAGLYGGAIGGMGFKGTLNNNTFTNNSAGLYGGAILWNSHDFLGYIMASNGTLNNNTFNNNHAQLGGAIYWDGDNGTLNNNTFTNNIADNFGSALYVTSNPKINYNIFLNNAGEYVIYLNDSEGNTEGFDINYNWFGNNVTNYNVLPANQNNDTTWLFLNVSANPESVSLFSSTEITFKLWAYNTQTGISKFDNSKLPKLNLTISATNGNISVDSVQLGDKATYTATELGMGSITATIGGVTQTTEIAIFNKLNPDLNIDPYNISVKDVNGMMFKITMAESATGNITLSLNDVSLGTMNVREFFIKYGGQFIGNLRNDNKTAGLYTLTATYSGDAIYDSLTVSASSTIEKFTPEINVVASNINYGETAKIKVTVNATGQVTITVDGKTYTQDLVNNTATFAISKLSVGVKNVTVNYNGDANNTESQKKISFTVNKLGTKITASAVSTTYNVDKKFVITLKDSKGKVLSGVKVTVTLGSSKKYTTDKNGQIKISIGSLVPKTYTAKISFAGNANYKASSASAKVTVQKATPKMTAKAKTFKVKDKTKKYTITLKNNKGKVMKSTKVSLKVNGKTYSVKTNSKGIATFKLTKLTKKGKFSAVITYSGDKYYKKLTKKVTMTVKA